MSSFSHFARTGLVGLLLLVLFGLPAIGLADSNQPATATPTATRTPAPTIPPPTQTPQPSETPYGAQRPTYTPSYLGPYTGAAGAGVDDDGTTQSWFSDLTSLDILLIIAIVLALLFLGGVGVFSFYRWSRGSEG